MGVPAVDAAQTEDTRDSLEERHYLAAYYRDNPEVLGREDRVRIDFDTAEVDNGRNAADSRVDCKTTVAAGLERAAMDSSWFVAVDWADFAVVASVMGPEHGDVGWVAKNSKNQKIKFKKLFYLTCGG